MRRRTRRCSIILVLVATGLLLSACGGGEPLIYRVTGSASQAEVIYADGDGASHTETVSPPWETSLKAGGSADFSLVVQNTGDGGDIRCTVLLGEKELGHADATQYASCEGSYRKSGGSLSVAFESSSDVLPDGSPAVKKPAESAAEADLATEMPAVEAETATAAVVAEAGPRSNGGSSGVVAFVGRPREGPLTRSQLFLLKFDGLESRVMPLTDDIGRADHPVWSPDGTKLLITRAFPDSGLVPTGDLWVWDTATSELRDLSEGLDDQGEAQWSPDGSRIAYTSKGDGKSDIYVMDADGSASVKLTQHAADDWFPRWSPDGETIYFLSDRDDRWYEVFAVDVDGGNLRQLTDAKERIWSLEVSPTGQQLAFLRDRDIHVANVDGTGETNLTNEGTERSFPHFAWSPDGSQIAFDSWRAGPSGSDIYVMDADGSNETRLTTDPEDDEFPRWTPDGTMISFVSKRNGLPQLYLVNADGTGVMRLGEYEDWDEFRHAWQPAQGTLQVQLPDKPLSVPTATPQPFRDTVAVLGRIVFASDRDGNWDIYSVRADGSDLIQLTDNDNFDGQPVWSPDGASILFVSDRDGNPEIYRMAPDGSDVARLTDDPAVDEFPVWSPNSRLIAFTSDRSGDADIYLMQADGTEARPLVTGPGKDWVSAWSHAAPEIAFVSDREGESDLYVVDDDGNVRRLTEGLGTVYAGGWAPNGRFIAFAASPEENYDVYIIRPDGTDMERITDHEAADYMPQWSPDSNLIVFVSTRDGNPEIYVQNEAGEVLRLTEDPADDNFPSWGPTEE